MINEKIKELAEKQWSNVGFTPDENPKETYLSGVEFGYQEAKKELPTWDDVREAIRATQKFGITEDSIIELLKKTK